MIVERLRFTEFRQYRQLDLRLPPTGLLLVGPNASGKSSLLEAIAMLSTTKSDRTNSERELINWESGTDLGLAPYARIEGDIQRAAGLASVEIGLQTDSGASGRLKKLVSVNGKRVRSGTAVGTLKSVLFEPGDIDLIAGSPATRRRFLDVMLSQLDGVYLRALSRYIRIVEQRNSLIKSFVQNNVDWRTATSRQQLDFWDGELIAHGSKVVARRLLATSELARFSTARFAAFSDGLALEVAYRSTVSTPAEALQAFDELVHLVAFDMAAAVDRERHNEFRRGVTLVGPHRDDLQISLEGVDLGSYGSRGQQRLAVIALKLAEADLMRESAGESPIVLLDDIFSELDERHRALLAGSLSDLGAQIIVTATDQSVPDLAGLDLGRTASVYNGQVRIAGTAAVSCTSRISVGG